MKRREATIALLALGIGSAAGAQPTARVRRIGFLGLSSTSDYAPYLKGFREGLRDAGYQEGRNIEIEFRWANGREERLPELAGELVRLKPDVLVTHATGVRAAQEATSTIPIVMGASADPVGLGLIKSLAKPGGNTTGIASQMVDLSSKRLELLKEIVPNLKEVAVLSHASSPASRKALAETEAAAQNLGVRVRSFSVAADSSTLESVLADILRQRPSGLIVQPYPYSATQGVQIATFALKNGLPAMGGGRWFVVDGGLVAYGGDFVEGWRIAARYVAQILAGARPADLPVAQPTKFELAINLKTAKALGLTIPASLLLRANEVVQ